MARLFTVDEANALLPQLTQSFQRIQAIQATAAPVRQRLSVLLLKGHSNGRDLATEVRAEQDRLESYAKESQAILDEITSLGIELKDLEQGLVDFPSQRGDRVVYLCWKLGEDRIRFWHETSTGFAGRQPLE
jgi:hypothetical protein